jgi:predicted amidohydrolase
MRSGHRLTIALAQQAFACGERDVNLRRAEDSVRNATQHQADLVLLPELWDSGYHLAVSAADASQLGNGIFGALSAWAVRYQVCIAGSVAAREGDRLYNTAFLYDLDGTCAAAYHKLHLFRPLDEHTVFASGKSAPTFLCPWGRTALSICYDLRFPELYRYYALQGVDLVLVPAAWPHTRVDHWRILTKARAIENGLAIAACNHPCDDRRTPFGGHSTLIDPWGRTVVEAQEKPALVVGTLDLAEVHPARTAIPVLTDRRPDIYPI